MWTIFKVFTEFVTVFLLFSVLVFLATRRGILAPQPGIEPTTPALEGEVLTTELLGKSLFFFFFRVFFHIEVLIANLEVY